MLGKTAKASVYAYVQGNACIRSRAIERHACASNLACIVCAHVSAAWHLKSPHFTQQAAMQAEVQQARWLGLQRLLLVAVRTARSASRSASHKQLRSSNYGNACNAPSCIYGRLGAVPLRPALVLTSLAYMGVLMGLVLQANSSISKSWLITVKPAHRQLRFVLSQVVGQLCTQKQAPDAPARAHPRQAR